MEITKSTLANFTEAQTIVKKISYVTKAKYNKGRGENSMMNKLGLTPDDIQTKVEGLKVLITNKPYIEVLKSLKNKEIDQEGIKAQLQFDSVDIQLAIKEATEKVKEEKSQIEAKTRRNPIHSISGVLSQYGDEDRYYLNYYPIYEDKAKYTTLIKGVEATPEQLAQLEEYKPKTKKSEGSTIKEFDFTREVRYRNVSLDNLIQ
jgi:phosphoglycolate phosphatase-like HAD superfamily hydrolase